MQLVGFFNFYKIADIRYCHCVIRCFIVRIRYLLPKRAVLLENLQVERFRYFGCVIFYFIASFRHSVGEPVA